MAEYNYLSDGRPDGAMLGNDATDKVGFYGTTPAAQRSSASQASSAVVTSASYGTLQVAQMQEVMATLTALGLWKGSA